jgi:hypothetical protein
MTVLITLTAAGPDTGPFDLYTDLDGYVTPFETGITKNQLLAGYISVIVPDFATIIRAKSEGMCINFVDLVLDYLITTTTTTISPTTTTTTTASAIPCDSTVTSGGVGVTEYNIVLDPAGGNIIFEFNAAGIPDKLEIIHNGIRKATTGMAVANAGPFDTLFGDPTVPTGPQVLAVDQFIGSSKGVINKREAEIFAELGITITTGSQQLVWWAYTNTDYMTNPTIVVRATGPDNTAWQLGRICPVTTTTTTTIAP